MKSKVAILLPLIFAVILLIEVAGTVRHGPFSMVLVVALMIAGICLGVAYAAWQAQR